MHHLEIFLFLIKNQVLSRLYKSRQVSSFLIHKELDPDIQVNWPGSTNFSASDSIHCSLYIYMRQCTFDSLFLLYIFYPIRDSIGWWPLMK
jgi:hypothetical protein